MMMMISLYLLVNVLLVCLDGANLLMPEEIEEQETSQFDGFEMSVCTEGELKTTPPPDGCSVYAFYERKDDQYRKIDVVTIKLNGCVESLGVPLVPEGPIICICQIGKSNYYYRTPPKAIAKSGCIHHESKSNSMPLTIYKDDERSIFIDSSGFEMFECTLNKFKATSIPDSNAVYAFYEDKGDFYSKLPHSSKIINGSVESVDHWNAMDDGILVVCIGKQRNSNHLYRSQSMRFEKRGNERIFDPVKVIIIIVCCVVALCIGAVCYFVYGRRKRNQNAQPQKINAQPMVSQQQGMMMVNAQPMAPQQFQSYPQPMPMNHGTRDECGGYNEGEGNQNYVIPMAPNV